MNNLGVGYYRKTDTPHTLHATWTTAAMGSKGLGTGVVRGDTSHGFAGAYVVTYYLPDGSPAGTFDLRIERASSAYRLSWSQDGREMYEGIGMETPEGLSISFARKSE